MPLAYPRPLAARSIRFRITYRTAITTRGAMKTIRAAMKVMSMPPPILPNGSTSVTSL